VHSRDEKSCSMPLLSNPLNEIATWFYIHFNSGRVWCVVTARQANSLLACPLICLSNVLAQSLHNPNQKVLLFNVFEGNSGGVGRGDSSVPIMVLPIVLNGYRVKSNMNTQVCGKAM